MKKILHAFLIGVFCFSSVVHAAGINIPAGQSGTAGKGQELFAAIGDLKSLDLSLIQKEIALNFEKTLEFPSLEGIEKIDQQLTEKFQAMEALQDVEGENYEGIYVLEEQIADLKLQRQYFEDTYKNRREKQSINILKISNEIEDLREDLQKQQQLIRARFSQAAGYFGALFGVIFLLFVFRYAGGLFIGRLSRNLTEARRKILQKINKLTFNFIIGLVLLGGLFSQVVNLLPFIAIFGTGVAFAIRDSISSFIGWFVIGSERGFKVGDIIRAGNVYGRVHDVGPFLTVVQAINHGRKTTEFLSFPNKIIFEQEIEHYSRFQGIVENVISFWFSPESDIEGLEQALLKLARDRKQFSFIDMNSASQKKNLERFSPHVFTEVEPRGVKVGLVFFAEIEKADKVSSAMTKIFLQIIKNGKMGSLICEGNEYNGSAEKHKPSKKQKDNLH